MEPLCLESGPNLLAACVALLNDGLNFWQKRERIREILGQNADRHLITLVVFPNRPAVKANLSCDPADAPALCAELLDLGKSRLMLGLGLRVGEGYLHGDRRGCWQWCARRHGWRRLRISVHRRCGGPQLWPMAFQHPLERVTKILNEVPAIGDLDGVGRAACHPVNGGISAVTAHHFDGRMLLQPGGHCVGGTFRQDINRLAPLEINNQGSIVATLPLGPIVNADTARWWWRWDWGLANQAEKRIRTTGYPQARSETSAEFTRHGTGDQLLLIPQAGRHAGIRWGNEGQALHKGLAHTRGRLTAKTAEVEHDPQASASPREVLKDPLIVAVDARRTRTTGRAGGR